MKVEVRFFAQLIELTGQEKLVIESVKDTEGLKEMLFAKYPSLADVPFALAVGTEMIHGNQELHDEDQVAFLPPFAGG